MEQFQRDGESMSNKYYIEAINWPLLIIALLISFGIFFIMAITAYLIIMLMQVGGLIFVALVCALTFVLFVYIYVDSAFIKKVYINEIEIKKTKHKRKELK